MGVKATKEISNEVRLLRYMRIKSGASLEAAGRKIGISGSAISHIESGRMDLPAERIEHMVAAYGFSMSEFLIMSRKKNIPTDPRKECEKLLKVIPAAKLSDLLSFMKSIR